MAELANYHHFDGLPWATGYLVNALGYQGVTAPHTGQPYSEALLMGINGGLCAGYFSFEYTGELPHLHFLTRYLFDEEPGKVFERLAIPMRVQQTTDSTKAAANVINALAQGKPAIIWGDVLSLPYNSFAPGAGYWLIMPVLVYGYDPVGEVKIADRARVGLTASAADLSVARAKIGKVKNRMMTIGAPNPDKLTDAVRSGIQACIDIMLHEPPVGHKSSFGLDAYQKWAKLLESKTKDSWAVRFAPGARMYAGLTSSYRYIQVWFTGGRGARQIYADFLDEAAIILENPALHAVGQHFRAAAVAWDGLTAALLPDAVPLFRETRELTDRSYHLFLDQGNASVDERRALHQRLKVLETTAAKDFPLSATEAVAMRQNLREHVLHVHDVEKIALSALMEAMA
ncbi:MAG: DUF4872 domain-containing protein [Anaerolineae bacterium]|nr:DUF4872 domain-containing protein [Anaerolineae bacterium]